MCPTSRCAIWPRPRKSRCLPKPSRCRWFASPPCLCSTCCAEPTHDRERTSMSTVLDSVASWTAPIQGASPTGTPARGDDDYEKLRAEIAKLSAADGAGPSWSDVYTLATEILTRKSKDLMVASYLCAALVDRDGARGLQAGLQLYKNLCTDYWPQLFPEIERVRGRVSAIAWLSEQAAKNLARCGRRGAAPGRPETARRARHALGREAVRPDAWRGFAQGRLADRVGRGPGRGAQAGGHHRDGRGRVLGRCRCRSRRNRLRRRREVGPGSGPRQPAQRGRLPAPGQSGRLLVVSLPAHRRVAAHRAHPAGHRWQDPGSAADRPQVAHRGPGPGLQLGGADRAM